ncbi:metal-dependent transcriptional regulator [Culicoidibacter larvae]|uniref:Manganese transport regulator n=1 Tax=Culicoidibacter larvae TaxID=2579976 RepID=A0A5R8QF68_9FIRM|nr:metal-dependent transcriptional regulator [Culicoidibacter larvae]TLG76638.1 metal-dependent transcriptional regulator [Culicoidibacter larvae]
MSIEKLSKSEQDYIKAIYSLQKKNDGEMISFKALSENLEHAPATVNGMVKRLAKKNLVIFESYKGVRLTKEGFHEAQFILKSHRVWETFLVQKIGYQLEEVHEEAEILEHSASPKLIERLYAFLDYPERCPHGTLIPKHIFWSETQHEVSLANIASDVRAEVLSISLEGQSYLAMLNINESPRFIKVSERLNDGTCILKTDDEKLIVIPAYLQDGWQLRIYQ